MKEGNFRAFTLIELIVVIAILAILWTITFTSLQWYVSYSRDATRLSDLINIRKVLDIYSIWTWKYPNTTDWVDITFSWSTQLWSQWIYGNDTFKTVWKLSKIPKDPLTQEEYI